MSTKQLNWRLWTGLVLSVLALLAYVSFFSINRNIFWLSLILFLAAAVFLAGGLQRAFRQPELYRGKVAGPLTATVCIVIFAVFGVGSYQAHKLLPSADRAPKLGQKAPEFTLPDSSGSPVSLAQLLAAPLKDSSGASRAPKGVLVVFYRGYW